MYLLPGTELNHRYVIESLLGHGGFGITYAADDQVLGARVAIKEYLPRHLATRAEGRTQVSVYSGAARQHFDYGLKKFMEEAQVLAQFSHHPNVVSARDYFEANGTAYMVMEYVEGVTLKEYLENKGGRISFEEAQGIMMPVMDALREVHQAGLLHRDISPDNIYITIAAQIRVIDFGAARYYAGEQSKSLSVILKPGYAPEEQYRSSGKQGAWTDVYAVGATIYKALTGQTPPDALDRKEEDSLKPPSQLGVSLRAPAERALMKAMAVSASQRFQTIGEFQQAFTEGKSMPMGAPPGKQPAFTPTPPAPLKPPPSPTPASVRTPPPAPQALLSRVPGRAWVVVLAGMVVNSCLGILYAWSVWSRALINVPKAGQVITEGVGAGWPYLTNAEAATPFSLCVIIFALMMIPGGKVQDALGPKVGAILGGLFLGLGCIIAGMAKSYGGLVLGFGMFGGIGMGIGYAAATPAALKWFGPHQRGLVAGLVVGGYGFAALYIAPLGAYLIQAGGISYSFIFLGIFFFLMITGAGCLLAWPGPGYVVPVPPPRALSAHAPGLEYRPSEMLQTWQFYVLVLMLIGTTQSGLLIIANGAPLLATTAKSSPFLMANVWLLVSFGGLMNTLGRIGTGLYSDIFGRANAYTLNCIATALCLFLLPAIISSHSVFLLFVAVGVAYWQYGGGLALMPAYVADIYGTKNFGVNYGLVFIGWGLGFFITRLAGTIKDVTGSLSAAFYCSGVILIIFLTLSQILSNSIKYGNLFKYNDKR
jgi:OFA family oxalate/formate antiporter-like MFS transporter